MSFPGILPIAIPNGYPDLIIPGPGFEFPVWLWNGKEYVLHRRANSEAYEAASDSSNLSIQILSEKYKAMDYEKVKKEAIIRE